MRHDSRRLDDVAFEDDVDDVGIVGDVGDADAVDDVDVFGSVVRRWRRGRC